jgi:ribosomal protein L32E
MPLEVVARFHTEKVTLASSEAIMMNVIMMKQMLVKLKKKIYTRYSSQKYTKIKPKWERLNTINAKIKGSSFLQKTVKIP